MVERWRRVGAGEEYLGRFKSYPVAAKLLVPMVVSQQVGWLWIQLSGLGWAGLGLAGLLNQDNPLHKHPDTYHYTSQHRRQASNLPGLRLRYNFILRAGSFAERKLYSFSLRNTEDRNVYDVYIYYALS